MCKTVSKRIKQQWLHYFYIIFANFDLVERPHHSTTEISFSWFYNKGKLIFAYLFNLQQAFFRSIFSLLLYQNITSFSGISSLNFSLRASCLRSPHKRAFFSLRANSLINENNTKNCRNVMFNEYEYESLP